jgi:PAS domain-containing protein
LPIQAFWCVPVTVLCFFQENRKTLLRNYWQNVTNRYTPKSTPAPALESPDASRDRPAEASPRYEMLQAGLDLLDQGITVFDGDLRLVAWNRTFLQLLEFPDQLAYVGAPFEGFIRYNAERGEYGPGDREVQIAQRVAAARNFSPHVTERQRPNGRVLLLRGEPLAHRGFVTLYSDVTEQRYIEHLTEHQNIQLEERVRRRTAQLENAFANLRKANEENERIAAALGRSEAACA